MEQSEGGAIGAGRTVSNSNFVLYFCTCILVFAPVFATVFSTALVTVFVYFNQYLMEQNVGVALLGQGEEKASPIPIICICVFATGSVYLHQYLVEQSEREALLGQEGASPIPIICARLADAACTQNPLICKVAQQYFPIIFTIFAKN